MLAAAVVITTTDVEATTAVVVEEEDTTVVVPPMHVKTNADITVTCNRILVRRNVFLVTTIIKRRASTLIITIRSLSKYPEQTHPNPSIPIRLILLEKICTGIRNYVVTPVPHPSKNIPVRSVAPVVI